MPYNIQVPFDAFKLRLFSGETIVTPLSDFSTFRINEPLHQVADKYAEKYQEQILDKGGFSLNLPQFGAAPFERGSVSITFPSDKEHKKFPQLGIAFDYFYQKQEKGYWVVVPALALQAFAHNLEAITPQVQEAIRLYFLQNKRLSNVQNIISEIWYEQVDWEREEVLFSFPTPNEVYEQQKNNQELWLPRLASKLQITQRIAYGRTKELEQLKQALQNPFNKNILLVGENGVGKTALIYEVVRVLQQLQKLEIWETTAARLIKELIQDTGWQDNIVFLIKELAAGDSILFVRNLMELFEVGQYAGNEVSIGTYWKTTLSRGEVAMIAECTEEELAQIELKNPNYTALFQIIRIATPLNDLVSIITEKAKDLAAIKNINLSEDAIKEVIRLNQRYTPYSGFPGKPIRFLENMISDISEGSSVSKSLVIKRFCEETGMPIAMVDASIKMDVETVKSFFSNNVFGQPHAVEGIVNVLVSVKTALMRKEKPIASFLFVGPTGVGKTELAKVLAEFMFGNRDRMIRFDMSEYADPYSVMRLIGFQDKDGVLTSAVRREPFCVLLFDEIEKADPKFFDLLLPLLGEGRLTDSKGKTVNFCSTIIIMTSNIGAQGGRTVVFGGTASTSYKEQYMTAVQKHFRPELVNRFDEIIPFEPLSKDIVRHVVQREIAHLKRKEGLSMRRLALEIDPDVLDYLAEKGYNAKYGARHLQRTIREELIIPLATKLNLEDYDDRLDVMVFYKDNRINIEVDVDPKGFDMYLEELDKIVNTDQASRLRRNIQQLQEGIFYIELLNELKILQDTKEQEKDEFWKNKFYAERYHYLTNTKEKVDAAQASIQLYEIELSLACMGLRPYEEALSKDLEIWQDNFLNLKRELYACLNSDVGRCYLHLYGVPILPVFEFYLELLRYKQFEIEVQAVWYQDRYYQEALLHNQRYPEQPKDLFLKVLLDEDMSLVPPKNMPDAILFGVEIELLGDCVLLYLESESGIHRWKYNAKEDYRYWVQVQAQKLATPQNIHRKEFYKQAIPRRVIENESIRDTILDIKRNCAIADLSVLVAETLDEWFEIRLNAELL